MTQIEVSKISDVQGWEGLNSNLKEGFLTLYEESFPYEERRTIPSLVHAIEHQNCTLMLIHRDNDLIGFSVHYALAHFYYLEYLCITPKQRGNKIGTEWLGKLLQNHPNMPWILECEPPTLSLIAQRRLRMYQREQFSIVSEDYMQKAYHKDSQPVHLFLLANTPNLDTLLAKEEIWGLFENEPTTQSI